MLESKGGSVHFPSCNVDKPVEGIEDLRLSVTPEEEEGAECTTNLTGGRGEQLLLARDDELAGLTRSLELGRIDLDLSESARQLAVNDLALAR